MDVGGDVGMALSLAEASARMHSQSIVSLLGLQLGRSCLPATVVFDRNVICRAGYPSEFNSWGHFDFGRHLSWSAVVFCIHVWHWEPRHPEEET